MTEPLVCQDGPDGCSGEVEWTTTPDRQDFKHFPRCEAHFAKRLAQAEQNLELLSDTEPAWFDPGYAGEQWREEE